MIAVTFALPTESSEFLRRLKNKSHGDRNGMRIIRGKIDNHEIEVFHTGVGEKACRKRVAKFLQDQQFDLLISAGFAGALNEQFKVGDLLLAKNFSTIELNNRRKFFSSLPIHEVDLLTVSEMIDSSEKRLEIAQTSGAAAVDMETEFIAGACANHGIPLLSLRVISDTLDEPFPAPSKVLFDIEQQRTRFPTLATFFLAHPNHVPRLIQFARRIARARKILTGALAVVISEL
jgi:adenosylhomocysteine nucleosidase